MAATGIQLSIYPMDTMELFNHLMIGNNEHPSAEPPRPKGGRRIRQCLLSSTQAKGGNTSWGTPAKATPTDTLISVCGVTTRTFIELRVESCY
jgi:hypothetical protein